MTATIIADLKKRMDGSIAAFHKDLSGLRTGRASVNLVDNLQVEVYGAMMPLNQVATVSVPEPRMISLQVWDKSNIASVEKSIRIAELGINPVVDGTLIRLPIPPLTEERRKELAKMAHGFAEKAKIAIRNVRRDGMDAVKKAEKDKKISQDDEKRESENIQKLTDDYVGQVDSLLKAKETDIMKV